MTTDNAAPSHGGTPALPSLFLILGLTTPVPPLSSLTTKDAPMPENAVSGRGSCVLAPGIYQLTTPQSLQGELYGAFRESGSFRNRAQAGGDWFPALAPGLAVEMEINEKRRRLLVMPNKVAHQDVEHIVVDRDGLAETRHHGALAAIPFTGQYFRSWPHRRDWTTAQAQSNLELP
jgi:hypothetical protein